MDAPGHGDALMIAERVADVVTVEVIRNALNAAADEMGTSLARSAYTPIIYEMKDYSVAIFNQRFELLGQAPGLPIFLGALEDAVRVTVTRTPGTDVDDASAYITDGLATVTAVGEPLSRKRQRV